jgi:hypothetical protein
MGKYNITLAEYDELLAAQAGVCMVCGTPPSRRPLDVDHCHSSGKVRGLLCENCNKALGLVQDRVDILIKLKEYLDAYSVPRH